MKAILVKEMPKNCLDCDGWKNAMGGYGCIYGDFTFEDLYIRQSECPFRPLPDKRNTISLIETKHEAEKNYVTPQHQAGFNRGWNACLDAITGGEEK